MSWKLAILAMLTYACLAIFIPIYFAKLLQLLLANQNEGRKAYLSYFLESLRAVKDLLQFQVLEEQFAQLTEKVSWSMPLIVRWRRHNSYRWP